MEPTSPKSFDEDPPIHTVTVEVGGNEKEDAETQLIRSLQNQLHMVRSDRKKVIRRPRVQETTDTALLP